MVDKGLEEIQEKNNVGQKLHNSTAFHGWVDKKHGLEYGHSIKLQAAEGSFVAQAAVWNNRLRSR